MTSDTRRGLLLRGTAYTGAAMIAPRVILRPGSAEVAVAAVVAVAQAVVAIVGFFRQQQFAQNVEAGLHDIKQQLSIIELKIDEVLEILKNLPDVIRRELEKNSREEAAKSVNAIEQTLIVEFADIRDLSRIPPAKVARLTQIGDEMQRQGFYVAEWGAVGYAFVARAFADALVAYTLTRASKDFLKGLASGYLQYLTRFRDGFVASLTDAEAKFADAEKRVQSYPRAFHLRSWDELPERDPDSRGGPPRRVYYSEYGDLMGDINSGFSGSWRKESHGPGANPRGWPEFPGANGNHSRAVEIANGQAEIYRSNRAIANDLRPHAEATKQIVAGIEDYIRHL